MAFRYPERWRIAGNPREPGAFRLKMGKQKLRCIASHDCGWEHVSVSIKGVKIPTWDQMSFVKRMFWDEDDLVVQYHPAEDNYVNIHPGVLHLWRKAGTNNYVETPPLELI